MTGNAYGLARNRHRDEPEAKPGQDDAGPDCVIGIEVDAELRDIVAGRAEEAEMTVAIQDFLTDNRFTPQHLPISSPPGPYHLLLGGKGNSLTIEIKSRSNIVLQRVSLGLTAMRRVARDYRVLCERYEAALRSMSPAQAEAVDMGRRSLHDEAARSLVDSLAGDIDVDLDTARRLFTLLYVFLAPRPG